MIVYVSLTVYRRSCDSGGHRGCRCRSRCWRRNNVVVVASEVDSFRVCLHPSPTDSWLKINKRTDGVSQ